MSSFPAGSAWPQSLGPLKKVDDLLRCGICFDYFNIAMIIPQCSHNYCSLCIRKSLSYKAQCPTCCMAATGPDLKNNRILDELVQTFTSASGGHTKKFLPKVVYNLLSDRDLKKKLKEYGLSTQGTKQQLIKRHQEFVHMYNSQCDSLNPKSVAEIVKELENTEKTRVQLESSTPRGESMTFTKNQTENEIDEIHSNYRKKHKAEFQLLIDQMNKQKKHASKGNIKEEPQEKETTTEELSIEIGEKMCVEEEQTHWAPITDHSPKTASLDCDRSQRLNLPDVGGMPSASSFQSSGSSVSSSSDIIRDLEIAGMCSDSSDNNSLPDKKTTKQKSRHFRSSSPVFPQSKRRKK
nr:E3 ubiquitin-protein ligase RAD18 isoform X4 [Anolis sagrei ordinatus]